MSKQHDFARRSQAVVLPPVKQREILARQGNCCFWCHLPFGTRIAEPTKQKLHLLRTEWDHLIPLHYSKTFNSFVAACQLCNKLRGARVAPIPQLAQMLRAEWAQKYRRA